jgi:hypothetical protein
MRVDMTNFLLAAATFTAFALLWGAWKLRQRKGMVQKVWLMGVAALVILGNVAIWTVPDENGRSLVNQKTD